MSIAVHPLDFLFASVPGAAVPSGDLQAGIIKSPDQSICVCVFFHSNCSNGLVCVCVCVSGNKRGRCDGPHHNFRIYIGNINYILKSSDHICTVLTQTVGLNERMYIFEYLASM